MRRSLRFTRFAICCVVLVAGCDEDDDAALPCPTPDDPRMVTDCLLERIEEARPSDRDTVTYEIELLLRDGTDYLYALVPSAFDLPINVYDACCALDCQLGVFPGPGCPWRNDAEDLGTIYP